MILPEAPRPRSKRLSAMAQTRSNPHKIPPHSVPSEKALAVLWQRAHALPEGLVTQDGRRLKVIYPGRPNHRAGPDFHDAIIADDAKN